MTVVLPLPPQRKQNMCGTPETRTRLPMASTAQTGCSCCSPAGETQAGTQDAVQPVIPAASSEYSLEGLTCGHCVQTVENAVSGVPGVRTATVDLVAGGTSRLSITGTADLAALAAAVRSSGYVLTGAN